MGKMAGWLSVLCLISVFPAAHAEEEAPQPDIHVGDAWNFKREDAFDHSLIAVIIQKTATVSDKDITLVTTVAETSKNSSRRLMVYTDRNLNDIDLISLKYDPARNLYKFPLHVGDSHPIKYTTESRYNPASLSCSGTSRVVKTESVTVEAGTFDTFRIESSYQCQRMDSTSLMIEENLVSWYAPAAKRMVKIGFQAKMGGRLRESTIDEMTSYELNTAEN